jgi:hypothetical protein
MKKSILLFSLLFFIKSSFSQNTNLDYKSAIKIANLSTFDESYPTKINDTSSNNLYTTKTTLQLLHPTVAFQWKTKKNNFHEIELTNFSINKVGTKTEVINDTTHTRQTVSDGNLRTISIAMRYEYICNFNKSKDTKLVPSLGFGINPYYQRNSYIPTISSSFSTSETGIGAKFFVTPRLTYYLLPKLFVDVNLPICITDSYMITNKDDNPALTAQDRTISSFNFQEFPKAFSGRIGIGLKL